MTDFDVQPAALRQLAEMLGRACQDLDSARTHLALMENFEGGTGQLGYCLDGHKAAYRTMSDWLGKLADPTVSGTSTAVAESASYYERTDAASAATLDATYPDTDVTKYKEDTGYLDIESEGSARFADVVDPGKYLTKPHDYGNELYAITWIGGTALA